MIIRTILALLFLCSNAWAGNVVMMGGGVAASGVPSGTLLFGSNSIHASNTSDEYQYDNFFVTKLYSISYSSVQLGSIYIYLGGGTTSGRTAAPCVYDNSGALVACSNNYYTVTNAYEANAFREFTFTNVWLDSSKQYRVLIYGGLDTVNHQFKLKVSSTNQSGMSTVKTVARSGTYLAPKSTFPSIGSISTSYNFGDIDGGVYATSK